MSPLPLTPSFTRAIGSTLNVVVVGDNRIGMVPAKGIEVAEPLGEAVADLRLGLGDGLHAGHGKHDVVGIFPGNLENGRGLGGGR